MCEISRSALQDAGPPATIVPHPKQFPIDHWRQHRQWSFLFVPYDVEDKSDGEHLFFCDACSPPKWLKSSGGTGNLVHHVEHSHRPLYTQKLSHELGTRQGKIPITNFQLLALTLEQNLPFSFADSPRLRAVADIPCDRKGLSEFTETIHGRLKARLRDDFQGVREFALVLDEWSDAKQRQFVGIKVHYCYRSEYRAACIGHVPLSDAPADAAHLAEATLQTLQWYVIDERVRFLVSDTATVMPATARLLKKGWSPCWAHIFNLMLKQIVIAVKKECVSPISKVARLVAVSTKWRKLVYHNQRFRLSSIGSYSETRWYSLWKLLKNALALREEVRAFIGEPWASNLEQFDALYGRLTQLYRVVTTFKSATEAVESDRFGSLSVVHSCLYLIRSVCVREAETWENFARGWAKAYEEYWRRYLGDDEQVAAVADEHGLPMGDRVLLAAVLNPVVLLEPVMSEAVAGKTWSLLESIWTARCSAPNPVPDPVVRRRRPPPVHVDGAMSLVNLEREPEGIREPENELARYKSFSREALRRQVRAEKPGEEAIELTFDLLAWWQTNKPSFPMLYRIACSYLIVPASSASVERQFSKGKLINSDRRTSLAEERLEQLVFLREHLDDLPME